MTAASKNLTVMFVDLKGYTSRSHSQTREQNLKLIQAFANTVRPIIEKYRGRIVKSLGDALLAAFDSSTDAVLGGIAVQKRIDQINLKRNEVSRFEVRVAISTGDVQIEDNDIFGDAVNLASRIEGLTPENEIYFSESVFYTMNKNEIEYQEVGKFDIRGFSDATTLYKAIWQQEAINKRGHSAARQPSRRAVSVADKNILPPSAFLKRPDFQKLSSTPLTRVSIHKTIEKASNVLSNGAQNRSYRPQFFAMQESIDTKAPEPFFTYAILNLFQFVGFLSDGKFLIVTRPTMIRSVDIRANKSLINLLSTEQPSVTNIPLPNVYKQMATSIHVSWQQDQNISDSSFVSLWKQLVNSSASGTGISVYDFSRIMLRANATIRFESKKGGKQNIIVKALQKN